MTHRLLVQYGRPTDPAAFDQHYRDVHIPLAQQLPGLVQFTTGRPNPLGGGDAPYLVAQLDFESAEAMGAALQSPEGAATAGDVPTFASGGAAMCSFDIEHASS